MSSLLHILRRTFQRRQRLFLGLLIAVATLSFSGGCSRSEWAIGWAGKYLSWKIDDQFDFSGDSASAIRKESDAFVIKMRHDQFPKWAQLLNQTADEFSALPLDDNQKTHTWVALQFSQGEVFFQKVMGPELLPFALKVANEIHEKNWKSFLLNFEKENKKIQKESEKKNSCYDHLSEELEDWIGSLSDEQKALLEKHCSLSSPKEQAELKIKQRKDYLLQFEQATQCNDKEFNQNKFQEAAPGILKSWLENGAATRSAEAEKAWQLRKDRMIQTLGDVAHLLSAKQKQKLLSHLRERAEGLQKMSLKD